MAAAQTAHKEAEYQVQILTQEETPWPVKHQAEMGKILQVMNVKKGRRARVGDDSERF